MTGRYYLAYRAEIGSDAHPSLWLARRYKTAASAKAGERGALPLAAKWQTSAPVIIVNVLDATA